MARAKKKLRRFTDAAKQRGDLDAWRRGRAVLGYISGRRVVELAAELDVTRGVQALDVRGQDSVSDLSSEGGLMWSWNSAAPERGAAARRSAQLHSIGTALASLLV